MNDTPTATTILTAVYDDFDTLKDTVPQSIETRWIVVTDNPSWPSSYNGWEVVYEPRPGVHPRRAAKTPKCLPWLYTDTDSSIWVDASFKIVSSNFAEEILQYADPIAQFNHPWRQCAIAEARECIAIPKDKEEILQKQINYLLQQGHPESWGLWATGIIARYHTLEIIKMGFEWLADIYNFSYRDQVSHPNVCRKYGLRPVNLPGTHFVNQWLEYQGSARH